MLEHEWNKESDLEQFKITVVGNKHVFTILDTKSQNAVFTEILRFVDEDGVFINTLCNRQKIIGSLSKLGKNISESRFLSILKEIADKDMLVRIKKSEYRVNQEYINRV